MRGRVLNAAIVKADVRDSVEEYLAIFDAFHADDIEVSDETRAEPIRGKARVPRERSKWITPRKSASIYQNQVKLMYYGVTGD